MWVLWVMLGGFLIYVIALVIQNWENKEVKQTFMGCSMLIGIVLGIVALSWILVKAKTLGLCLLAGIVVTILFFVVRRYCRNVSNTVALERSGSISVSSDRIVTIYKRTSLFKECIAVQEYTYRLKHYQEAEQYYVGATVGGVHMGGVHEHPEAEVDGRLIYSGKYVLTLITHGITPTHFVLTDAILQQAQADPFIKSLLDGNKLMMMRRLDDVDYKLQNELRKNMTNLREKTHADNCVELNVVKSLLTENECKRVLNWLSGQ